MMRRPQRALIGALVVAFACAIPGGKPLEASTVLKLGVEEMATRCELALEASVTSKSASLDGRGRIGTDYALTVERTFFGAHTVQRTVRVPGGVLPDGRGLVLPGMPTLAVGESALLFLSGQNDHGERLPIGLAQGRLSVKTAPDGTKSLVRDVLDLDFVDAQGNRVPAGPQVSSLPYAATVARIEKACAGRSRDSAK
ncbi:MAG: hypothetical protein JNL28_00155 [Planctomycetes bacterium]|nr:hypothetical protein [Planctomycetota bacterium]